MKKIWIIILIFAYNNSQDVGVFIKPVSDLCLSEKCFDIPFITFNGVECNRVTQALFNEVVIIERYLNDKVLVRLSHSFIQKNTEKISSYWTQKSSILNFKELISNNIDLSVFPIPIDYNNYNTLENENILTLKLPYNNFSIGTRFVRNFKDTKDHFGIKLYNPIKKRVETLSIPKTHALIYKNMPYDARRKNFVSLLKFWIKSLSNIPYIWGGYSIIETFTDKEIEEHNLIFKGDKTVFWNRNIYTGIDCSGLVLLAAQMTKLPYFYKNTYTLAQYLKPLQLKEKIEEGDLIYFKGHVMIISNIAKNKLIESAGYYSGFGKVQEIELKKRFKNINTYSDLIKKYHAKKELILLDNLGNIFTKLSTFTIFKII